MTNDGLKTKQQKVAKLALECIERIKLLKEGKWKELDLNQNQTQEFLPETFDNFINYKNYEGAKKESFQSFLKWFFDEKKNKELRDILELAEGRDRKEKIENIKEYILNPDKPEVQEKVRKKELEEKLKIYYENFKSSFNYPNYIDEYSSHIKRLPSMIVSNGLIPTLLFYKSKGKDRGQIYQDVSEILEKLGFSPYVEWKENNTGKELLDFLLETDSQTLRLATTEILNIANWLKRVAEAELKEKEG